MLDLPVGLQPIHPRAKRIGKKLRKHTLESCKAEALKYKTRKEWSEKDYPSFIMAYRKRWFEECVKHMPCHTQSKLECLQQALKYKTRNEWATNHKSSYVAAKRNNWFEECIKHMGPRIINQYTKGATK